MQKSTIIILTVIIIFTAGAFLIARPTQDYKKIKGYNKQADMNIVTHKIEYSKGTTVRQGGSNSTTPSSSNSSLSGSSSSSSSSSSSNRSYSGGGSSYGK